MYKGPDPAGKMEIPVDTIKQLAAEHPGWRSQWEKDHVFAQFDEARSIYAQFAREAEQLRSTTSPNAQLGHVHLKLPALKGGLKYD